MIKRIISISGKPGLYRLMSHAKNMLIVEALGTGKRLPIYARDKVVSLGDISIYTTEGDEPLAEVFEKRVGQDRRKARRHQRLCRQRRHQRIFRRILPAFDKDRVYTTDIKKLFSWYNLLLENGITTFVEKPAAAPAAEAEN